MTGLFDALNDDQKARADALVIASAMLRPRALGNPAGGEVVYAAEWIVYGRDTDDPMETDDLTGEDS